MKKIILIIALMALAATAVLAVETTKAADKEITITNNTEGTSNDNGVKTKLQESSKEGPEYKYQYRRKHSYSYRHNNNGENSNCQYGKSRQGNRKK